MQRLLEGRRVVAVDPHHVPNDGGFRVLEGDGKDPAIGRALVLRHEVLVQQAVARQLETQPNQELGQMDRQTAQPDGPFVGQGVAPILAVGRPGLVENARGIPIAGVAPPAVLQRVLDGLGVVAFEGDTEGRQNPRLGPAVPARDLLDPKPHPILAARGNQGAFVTAHAAQPALPVTQGTRTVQQRPDDRPELHFIVPHRAIRLHILTQARNDRPQLDASPGQSLP